MVAYNCKVPSLMLIVVAFPSPATDIPATGIFWFVMVMTKNPYTPDPSFAVALAVTVPFTEAVTRPAALIVACPVPF
jgi:hypothetical protein